MRAHVGCATGAYPCPIPSGCTARLCDFSGSGCAVPGFAGCRLCVAASASTAAAGRVVSSSALAARVANDPRQQNVNRRAVCVVGFPCELSGQPPLVVPVFCPDVLRWVVVLPLVVDLPTILPEASKFFVVFPVVTDLPTDLPDALT